MIHLTTGVGGYVKVLPHMLRHYQGLGISSFLVNVHVGDKESPYFVDEVKKVTQKFGIDISSVNGGHWYETEQKVYERSRLDRPHDWFVLADQDELHQYPMEIERLVEFCEKRGYDYVTGCFVDRIALDGGLPEIDYNSDLASQFPLGAFLTFPLHGGYPMKVVLAKGAVKLSAGQHIAFTGKGCPMEEVFVQVHHYKWVGGLLEWLRQRKSVLLAGNSPWWVGAARTLEHYDLHGGKINLREPSFWVGECNPEYEHWQKIIEIAIADRQKKVLLRSHFGAIDAERLRLGFG